MTEKYNRRKKGYTQDERAKMLAFLFSAGYPFRRGAIRYTQEHTGVHNKHLKKWFLNVPKYVGFDNLKREIMELEKLLEIEVEAVFKELNKKRENATYKELGIIGGIMIDKLVALQGGVNVRTENIATSWKEIIDRVKKEGTV